MSQKTEGEIAGIKEMAEPFRMLLISIFFFRYLDMEQPNPMVGARFMHVSDKGNPVFIVHVNTFTPSPTPTPAGPYDLHGHTLEVEMGLDSKIVREEPTTFRHNIP